MNDKQFLMLLSEMEQLCKKHGIERIDAVLTPSSLTERVMDKIEQSLELDAKHIIFRESESDEQKYFRVEFDYSPIKGGIAQWSI